MRRKLHITIFSGLVLLLAFPVFAQQTGSGLGYGISVDYGVNPRSNYIAWDFETVKQRMYADSRFLLGPVFQFRNYDRFQVEAGLLFGSSVYKQGDQLSPVNQSLRVNKVEMPLRFIYNSPSPIRFHSAIVYHAGLRLSYNQIVPQGYIKDNYSFLSPSLSAGVRLSTEISSLGRIEYGITYNHSISQNQYFIVQVDDIASSMVTMRQDAGQWNLGLIYYFSPRVFNWSKSKYRLKNLE